VRVRLRVRLRVRVTIPNPIPEPNPDPTRLLFLERRQQGALAIAAEKAHLGNLE